MKAKYIYEKFVEAEDSDPIRDMGIGYAQAKDLNFTKTKDFYEYVLILIPYLTHSTKIPDDMLKGGGYINTIYYYKLIEHFITHNITFKNIEINDANCNVYYWPERIKSILVNKNYQRE